MENQSMFNNISTNAFNSSYLDTTSHPELEYSLISLCVICAVGTILNSLIIVVIIHGSLTKTSVFMILLLALAMTDNLNIWFVVLGENGIYTLLPYCSSFLLCQVINLISNTAGIVSSWLIVVIAVERTIAIYTGH